MSTPTLHSSQELTVHQMNAEQSFSPVSMPLPSFPSSPQAQSLRQGDAALLLAVSSFAPTPGGSNSTMPATIVRPEVRRRREWDLTAVSVFQLPPSALCQEVPDGGCEGARPARRVMVRYTADCYDQEWLTQLSSSRFQIPPSSHSCLPHTSPAQGHGGKTGDAGGGGTQDLLPALAVAYLEATVTVFEVAAYYNPQISLQQIALSYTESASAPAPSLPFAREELQQYWLRKRAAMGGRLPCLSALHVNVGEESEHALCTKDVLGDCPLPFRQRDWFVPAYRRCSAPARPGEQSTDAAITTLRASPRKRVDASSSADKLCADLRPDAVCSCAVSLCCAVLNREQVQRRHTHIALYEAAMLRRLTCCEPSVKSSKAGDQAVQLGDLFSDNDSCSIVVNEDTLVGILLQARAIHLGRPAQQTTK